MGPSKVRTCTHSWAHCGPCAVDAAPGPSPAPPQRPSRQHWTGPRLWDTAPYPPLLGPYPPPPHGVERGGGVPSYPPQIRPYTPNPRAAAELVSWAPRRAPRMPHSSAAESGPHGRPRHTVHTCPWGAGLRAAGAQGMSWACPPPPPPTHMRTTACATCRRCMPLGPPAVGDCGASPPGRAPRHSPDARSPPAPKPGPSQTPTPRHVLLRNQRRARQGRSHAPPCGGPCADRPIRWHSDKGPTCHVHFASNAPKQYTVRRVRCAPLTDAATWSPRVTCSPLLDLLWGAYIPQALGLPQASAPPPPRGWTIAFFNNLSLPPYHPCPPRTYRLSQFLNPPPFPPNQTSGGFPLRKANKYVHPEVPIGVLTKP